jgi:ribonuclease HI
MLTAYIDGGSRGNPGPAGYGVRIEDERGRPVAELSQALAVATNNVAEYRALVAALTWAAGHGCRSLRIRSDSELLVRQMRGEYRVRNAGLQPLYLEATRLLAQLGHVSFEHIRRELNTNADGLANRAMDEAAGGR